MSIQTAFGRYFAAIRDYRASARTERLIRSLPAEVQKDIGWPDQFGEGVHRHANRGIVR